MLGGTHLAFGTAVSLAAVGLAGIGLGPDAHWTHISLHWAHRGLLSVADLKPAAWLALVGAGAFGGILPDIDQPGSLITRAPSKQGKALQQLARPYGRTPIGGLALAATDGVAAGTNLASALLGGQSKRRSWGSRFLLLLLAALLAAVAGVLRWLPPTQVLSWPVTVRQALSVGCGVGALLFWLLAEGGVANLVHRLPGHHRGWTHAPPVALALAIASFSLGPSLFPALPGVGPAFAVGYISHLVADALTIRGIPLFWAGHQQPSLHLLPRPLRVRTGSIGETIFNICWLGALPGLVLLAAR